MGGGAVWTLLLVTGYLIKKHHALVPTTITIAALCLSLTAHFFLVGKAVANNAYSMEYGSIFTVVASASLFMVIIRYTSSIQHYSNRIIRCFTDFSTYSFSIYMIHIWVLSALSHISALHTINIYLHYSILLISGFLISFIIARYVLKFIPFLRKWLLLVK